VSFAKIGGADRGGGSPYMSPPCSIRRTLLVAIAGAVDDLPLGVEQPYLIKVGANLTPTLVVLFFSRV